MCGVIAKHTLSSVPDMHQMDASIASVVQMQERAQKAMKTCGLR